MDKRKLIIGMIVLIMLVGLGVSWKMSFAGQEEEMQTRSSTNPRSYPDMQEFQA